MNSIGVANDGSNDDEMTNTRVIPSCYGASFATAEYTWRFHYHKADVRVGWPTMAFEYFTKLGDLWSVSVIFGQRRIFNVIY